MMKLSWHRCMLWATVIGLFLMSMSATLYAQEPPITITENGTYEGELTGENVRDQYIFEGKFGDRLTIRMQSLAFDTYLLLMDAEGNSLTANDDAEGSLNALISDYVLEADGTYTLIATSSDETGIGAYTLTINLLSIMKVGYGEMVSSEIDEFSRVQMYSFEAKAGDTINISAESTDFDTYLTLYGPDDANALMYTDGSNGIGTNALIGAFTIPTDGTYFIAVNEEVIYEEQFGAYTLTLEETEIVDVSVGEWLTVHFGEGVPFLYYRFTAEPGDKLSIRIDSGGKMDTSFMLISLEGFPVWADDDSGAGYDPEMLDYLVEMGGTYIIQLEKIADLVEDHDNTVELSVSTETPTMIQLDERVTFYFDQKSRSRVFALEGASAGDYIIQLESNLNTENTLIYISQNGTMVDSTSGVDNWAVTLAPLDVADGQVRIVVQDYSYRPAEFTLVVTRDATE